MSIKKINPDIYYIIGMSPGNSYFKDKEIEYLLKTTVERYGRVLIMIADVPAIATYIAFGYPENRARRDKAIPRGNLLKNKVLKARDTLGYSKDQVRIIDWANEVEKNEYYKKSYQSIRSLYDTNKTFEEDANNATKNVLIGSKKTIDDLEDSIKTAVHYLLSEFAFLEWAPQFLDVKKIIYVYHKNWPIFENFIAGKYDNVPRPYLDFVLLENPWETYNQICEARDQANTENFVNDLDRVEKTKILKVSFSNYPPALIVDDKLQNFSGIFYEVIMAIAKKHDWKIQFIEEIGYGVIIDGLSSNRFDIFGSTVWPTTERKNQASFSTSLYSSFVFAWTSETKTVMDISTSRIVIKENDISHSIALADYPLARLVQVPQLAEPIDLLKFVVSDRGEMTFAENYLAEYFNKNSEIKVVKISKKPVREYENTFIFKKNDSSLKDLFDKEIMEMKNSGFIKKLIKKYTASENTFKLDH